MAKHFVAITAGLGLGLACGLGGLAAANPEEARLFYDGITDEIEGTELEVGSPSTTVQHLAAFAVGRISGSVTIIGAYDKVRWGPAPNCNIDIEMQIPFVAEPIVEINDLQITTTPVPGTDQVDVEARLQGEISVLNPRSKLDDFVLEGNDGGWGQICDENNYDTLLNTMWEIAGKATNTAAECLVGSVHSDNITDTNGNIIQSPASELQQLYIDDLRITLGALYPGARNIDVIFPEREPNFDISQTATYRALADAIAETDDDKYDINAEAVETCTFESVSIDVTPLDQD